MLAISGKRKGGHLSETERNTFGSIPIHHFLQDLTASQILKLAHVDAGNKDNLVDDKTWLVLDLKTL